MRRLILLTTIFFSTFAIAESRAPNSGSEHTHSHPPTNDGGSRSDDGSGSEAPGSDDSAPGGNDSHSGGNASSNGSSGGTTTSNGPPPPPPSQLCPNLFPSWLPDYSTPACVPTSQETPWLDTPEYRASATHSLLAPSRDYFVSCNGAEVVPLGSQQQQLASSMSGYFGDAFEVEAPCQVLPTLFCGPFTSGIIEEKIATATANAYVSLDAFNSYFAEKHSWSGFGNDGQPINAEFGNDNSLYTHGWNANTESVTFCPGAILHINVWAHELFHGIVQATTGFQYNNFGSSGGNGAREINEAYADFFAEMVQFHAGINDTSVAPGMAGDYRVSNGKSDFGAGGAFYDQERPCHSDPVVPTQAGYYTNGGPIRHMMYLLAEGTNPVGLPHSDVCQGPSVLEGIGRDPAAEVWFDALVNCDWRADGEMLNHCDARRCTLEAASCGTVRESVRDAWTAVELTAEACGVIDEILPDCPPPAETF